MFLTYNLDLSRLWIDAGQFKVAFEEAQKKNAEASNPQVVPADASPEEPTKPNDEVPAPEATEKEQAQVTDAEGTPKD